MFLYHHVTTDDEMHQEDTVYIHTCNLEDPLLHKFEQFRFVSCEGSGSQTSCTEESPPHLENT